jgi:hypothetical protein
MISPQLAAGLTAFVGACMLAGFLSAFRNRGYLGWLGLAFLSFSGSLLAADRAGQARALGADGASMALLAKILLAFCLLCFLLALVFAVRETARRLRDIREQHQAAADALLAMARARREGGERETREEPLEEGPEQRNRGEGAEE